MSIVAIAKKIISLLGTLNNPFFFMYRLCHYLNKDMPHWMAMSIYKKNLKEYKEDCSEDFLIDTYDGSGQAVHPDIAYCQNQYWLVITPYPYGMEEYENPCLYNGYDLKNLKAPQGPIAIQRKHTQGVHLSDPCLAINGNKLFCYYRESERKGNREENTIWEIQYNESEKKWGEASLLLDSIDDKILSPAMIFDDEGKLRIYYVSTLNDKYTLVSTLSNGVVHELTEHKIIGMPKDYDLWHIGISKMADITTDMSNTKELAGLFLMKPKKKGGGMKLFVAHNNGVESDWHVVKEVEMLDSIKDIVRFPYKSCFIPQSDGAILLSFRDKKSRNRLIIINNN